MNISIVKIALNWSLSAQLMSWISSIKEKLFLILTCKNRFAISLRTFFPRVQTPCLVLVHDKLNFIISSLMHPELVLYINYCFRFLCQHFLVLYLLTHSLRNFAFTDEPVVSVHLANEDPSRVITRAEGENVTLKCRADARPPVTSFAWYKNVSIICLHVNLGLTSGE